MIDARSPLLARLARARTDVAFDRAAVLLLLFERYRRALHRWTRPDLAREAAPADELRAKLESVMARSSERGDALLLAIREAVELLESGDGIVAQAALEAAYAAWVEYAIALYDAGDVGAATYIVAQVGADAELSGHVMLAARARDYEGFLAWREANIDESEALFRRAEQLARRSRSASMVQRARIGRAGLLRLRGNLPAAESMLDRVVRASRRRAPDVAPRALLMRANVAHARGQYADAVAFATRGLYEAVDERIQARILIELASLFVEFADTALAELARRILEHAAVHSPERATRHHAALNLLGLAVDQRRRDAFAKWRATLHSAALAPRPAIQYALYTVRGLRAFALADDPMPYLDAAEQLATEHGLAQFTFEIAEERDQVTAGRPASAAVADPSVRSMTVAPPRVHTDARRVAAMLASSAASAIGVED